MREQFINWKPNRATQILLSTIQEILDRYQKLGYVLTIRQLYYQLVSRNAIPNTIRQYKALVNVVSQGRLAGMIDWERIEDRVRNPSSNTHWNTGQGILRAAARSFYIDRWMNIPYHIEVWCEKDAVSNILQPVCSRWDVTFMANRGYSSQSAMYDASKRFIYSEQGGHRGVILYFGDHDPSGMDMTRDIKDRMDVFGSVVEVKRIALNMDQIEDYNPPENPAKKTDTRYKHYVSRHGESSWELDALEPTLLDKLAESSILVYVNKAEFKRVAERQEAIADKIRRIADEFVEVEK